MLTRRRLVTAAVVAAAALTAAWLWAETIDRRASRRWLGTRSAPRPKPRAQAGSVDDTTAADAPEMGEGAPTPADVPRVHAVVVLGYGNRGERANLVNRFRVRAGIRSLDPHAENLLVLCGGTVHSATPESVIMQRYAREHLDYTGRIALDTTSRSTRKNIAHAIPHLERADTISIVSNAPHAEMGRQILWAERPDLAAHLVRGAEHRLGEAPFLKIGVALRLVWNRVRLLWNPGKQLCLNALQR